MRNLTKNTNHNLNSIVYQNSTKKLRKQRQSLTNFVDKEMVIENNKKIDLYQKPCLSPRLPRMSENCTSYKEYEPFYSPQNFHYNQCVRVGFLSPKNMKKCNKSMKQQNSLYNEFQRKGSAKLVSNMSKAKQLNKTKRPIESQKQTLNKIQAILINHGIKIAQNQPINKTQKVNSKVERNFQGKKQQNYLSYSNQLRPQNKSFTNKAGQLFNLIYQIQQQQIQQLKETISTISSSKNLICSLKISDFSIGRQLGKGKFGVVKIARHKKTGMVFCIKTVKKSVIRNQQLINQFIKQLKIQNFLNHPNLVKLYTVFDDYEHVYLLLQLCCEGNLYNLIKNQKNFIQGNAKKIIKDICEGVSQLHHKDIIHRDLKPQNIVLNFKMAKITDFGWSTYTQQRNNLRETFCGTPLYVSPQLLKGDVYDQKVDLWAIGILAFEMFTGRLPFQIKTEKDLAKIVTDKIIYPSNMDTTAIQFVNCLLVKDPKKRFNIQEILKHCFLKNNSQTSKKLL